LIVNTKRAGLAPTLSATRLDRARIMRQRWSLRW
jgi:hypothetical protein